MRKIISKPPNYFYSGILLSLPFRFLLTPFNLIPFPFNLSGILLMAAGLYLVFAAYNLFAKRNTPENFQSASCVVTDGLYRFSRNPMYLGGVLFLGGLVILLQNIIALVVPVIFFLIMNAMFIPFEEEKMLKECGDEYRRYKDQVRRWI